MIVSAAPPAQPAASSNDTAAAGAASAATQDDVHYNIEWVQEDATDATRDLQSSGGAPQANVCPADVSNSAHRELARTVQPVSVGSHSSLDRDSPDKDSMA